MKVFNKIEKKVLKPVYRPINNEPCDLLDELRPLSLSEQVDKIYSISGKLELTRRRELADLRGVSLSVDPEDYETPLDSYKNPSLVDVRNVSDELYDKVDRNLHTMQNSQTANKNNNYFQNEKNLNVETPEQPQLEQPANGGN